MDDHVVVIQQDPPSPILPFNPKREDFRLFQAFLDRGGDCPDLAIGCSAAEDEIIRKAGNRADIEDDEVFRLFFHRGVETQQRPLPRISLFFPRQISSSSRMVAVPSAAPLFLPHPIMHGLFFH